MVLEKETFIIPARCRTTNLKCLDSILRPGFETSWRVHLICLNSPGYSKHITRWLALADSIYCADGGINRIIGKLVDVKLKFGSSRWIVGDLDSAEPQNVAEAQRKYGFEVHKHVDLYSTDFQKTLAQLQLHHGRSWSANELLIVEGAFGGRFDQSLCALSVAYQKDYSGSPLMLFFGDETVCCILQPGANQVLLPQVHYTGASDVLTRPRMSGEMEREVADTNAIITDVVGLLPLIPCKHVTTKGFTWDLHDDELSVEGLVSSSNGLPSVTTCVEIDTDEKLMFYMQLK